MPLRMVVAVVGLSISILAIGQNGNHPSAEKAEEVPVPEHPATSEQIREYFAVSHLLDNSHASVVKMLDLMRVNGAPYLPQGYWNDVQSGFANLDFDALYVPVYRKYLSEEDLKVVLGFYQSPAGQHLLTAQRLMAPYGQEVLDKKSREIVLSAYNRHKEEIEAAKAKYNADRQTTSQKNGGKQ